MLRSLLVATALCVLACSSPTPPRPQAAEETPTPTTPRPCRYAFPVQPAEDADYGPDHHDYPATDIFAPVGTEVVAPTDGVLDHLRTEDPWDPARDEPSTRGGLSFAIVGDDGIRYYGSHLHEIADGLEVGARVEAGAHLGTAGRSGNAASTPAHLHFGISRPTTPEDWEVRRGEIPPFEYLNAWQQGRDLTPQVPGARTPRCEPAG